MFPRDIFCLRNICQTPCIKNYIDDIITTIIIQFNYIEFLIIKPTRCTNFTSLVWNEILLVSDSSSVHHQEFFTVHTAMVYVVQFY